MAVVKKQNQPTQHDDIAPNGTYPATLTDIEQFSNAYGPRIGFEFTLQGGDVDGIKVMRSTSPNLSPRSKLADLLSGLMGRAIEKEEIAQGIDIEQLIGIECKVLVLQAQTKAGQTYSNVEQVFR